MFVRNYALSVLSRFVVVQRSRPWGLDWDTHARNRECVTGVWWRGIHVVCVHMLIVWLWTWVVVVVRVAVSSCVAVLVAGLSGDCRTDGGGSHGAVHSRKFGSTSLVGTGPRGWVAVASFGAGGEGRGPHSGPAEKVEARVALSPQFLFQAESLAECLFGLVRHRHGVVHSVGDCSDGVVLVRRREFGCVAAALPSAFVRACAGDCSLGGLAPPAGGGGVLAVRVVLAGRWCYRPRRR
jgi:hypothetical protein